MSLCISWVFVFYVCCRITFRRKSIAAGVIKAEVSHFCCSVFVLSSLHRVMRRLGNCFAGTAWWWPDCDRWSWHQLVRHFQAFRRSVLKKHVYKNTFQNLFFPLDDRCFLRGGQKQRVALARAVYANPALATVHSVCKVKKLCIHTKRQDLLATQILFYFEYFFLLFF